VPDPLISGHGFVRELTGLIARRGIEEMIVSDNGTELTSNAVLPGRGEIWVEWHYVAPGKSAQAEACRIMAQNEPVSCNSPLEATEA
jgi:putative transposase